MFLSQVFCLEKMGLIPLLRRLGGAKDRDDREALWEAAETYHRLHQVPQLLLVQQTPPPPLLSQVELCSGSGGGAVYGLALALTSLNLARRGLARPRVKVNIRFYSKLTSSPIINLYPPTQAEIYVLLATRLRLSWPGLPKLLQRRALMSAAKVAEKSEVDGELAWLVGHHGRQFFLNDTWRLARSSQEEEESWGLTSPPPALQPISQMVGV